MGCSPWKSYTWFHSVWEHKLQVTCIYFSKQACFLEYQVGQYFELFRLLLLNLQRGAQIRAFSPMHGAPSSIGIQSYMYDYYTVPERYDLSVTTPTHAW